MQEKKLNSPKSRIIETATNLFYKQGFESTGINQIIDESNSFKKSFYTYFQDKNQLALEYLEIQEKELLELLNKLMKKHSEYSNFVTAWTKFQKKIMYNDSYRGCPFALFTNQSIKNKEIFEEKIQEIFRNLENQLVTYIDFLKEKNKFPKKKQSKEIVKKIILYYEGAQQTYFMTKDLSYIKILEEELLKLKD